ncbi:lipoprotein-releasing system permease protein [Mariprofundus ferrinatatus]|uniref:Lipoprotein-releasing system permease protein n=1 Tax=Mariprofundus ferrinatatus TaxID=1921087 RepID=A0A2K8L3I8_9PROT|nr:lipoprotein-releasing ABC transporter permease subunit [Mariprofundus ferrinatatus]ATX81895.1 lipoprotein-releasing system permease protein [Mariprofundus ferrinatatus]
MSGLLFTPHERMLARRYLRSRRSERFVSLISWSSGIGIAIGVMTLIVVLSVMNGAAAEIRDKILGFSSHIDIQGPGDTLEGWQQWLTTVEALPDVKRAAPYIQGQVLASYGSRAFGALLKGVDVSRSDDIARHITHGRFVSSEGSPFQVVMGKTLVRKLGLQLGDQVRLMSPSGGVSPSGAAPRMRAFELVGIFDSGFHEYDIGVILTPIPAIQRLNRMGDAVTGIEVFLHDREVAARVAAEAQAALPPGAWIIDWQRRNRAFFNALKTERVAMGVILSLIIMVAVFNMVASLVMVVMERRKEIAILKTIGATRSSVMRVVMLMGAMLSGIGTLAGAVMGLLLAWKLDVLLAWIETMTGVQFMSGEVYFIDHIPSKIDPVSVGVIVVVSLIMGVMATLYPAWRAASVPPAEALRYE